MRSAAAAPSHKTVLLLFPYQHDLPMHVLARQALGEEFERANDLELDVCDEFLDLNRYPDGAFQQRLFAFLAAKYSHKKIDLVMVQTEVMLDLWLKQRDPLAPHAPVIFFDVVTEVPSRQFPPGVTGVSGTVDLVKSVEWMLRARPSVNEVALVQGVGQLDQGKDNRLPVDTFLREMRGKVRITDLSGFPFAEIQRRVAALPRKSSVVLFNIMFEDAAGVRHRPLDALREVAAAAAVPVLSAYDVTIGSGSIGGYCYSVEGQAREAARIGLRILRGETAGSIPAPRPWSEQFIFDHRALQRFDIPLAVLPPGSIVKHRQYSFWELYRTQLLSIFAGMAVLFLLVLFLLEVSRRLNRTRRALADLNVNLESQVQERTGSLRQTNARLQEEITERKEAEAALARSTAERLEQQAQLLKVEEERKQLARQQRLIRDLHDGLGVINANVALLAARADKETEPAARHQLLATIGRLASAGGLEVRELMNTLETREMPWGNLIYDLRRYAALVLDAAGLQWELVVTGEPPCVGLGALAGLSLLRVFREAMNNALKHAQARSLRLTIEFTAERCRIEIQDDGRGFAAGSTQPGRGLKNMRQRIEEMGGTLQMQAESGTRLSFDLPVPVGMAQAGPGRES